MSCIYKYKGKDYTKEEFYSLVSSSNFIQQEQARKFAELQERLNNKEFLEGAKNAFESNEELQNVYYEALGVGQNIKTKKTGLLDYFLNVKKDSVFQELIQIGENLGIGIEEYESDSPLQANWNGKNVTINKTYGKVTSNVIAHEVVHGILHTLTNNDYTNSKLNLKLEKFKTELFDYIEKKGINNLNLPPELRILKLDYIKKMSNQEIVTYAFTDSQFSDFLASIKTDVKVNSNESFWNKLINIFNTALKELGFTSKLDELIDILNTEVPLFNNVQIIPQQKQDALNAYTDYIARVSLGIIKNPSSGEYNYESKAKDIVYHGTNNPNFSGFGSDFSRAIHFGTLQAAKDRRSHTDFEFKNNAKFIPVLLNVKNPLKTKQDFNFEGDGLEFVDDPDFDFTKEEGHRLLITYLHNKGYNVYHPKGGVYRDGEILNNAGLDSVIYKNEREDKGNYSYAVFEPEQIHILGSKQDVEGFKEFVNKDNSLSENEEIGATSFEERQKERQVEQEDNTLQYRIPTREEIEECLKKPKAENGAKFSKFTKGSEWEVVSNLGAPSFTKGGEWRLEGAATHNTLGSDSPKIKAEKGIVISKFKPTKAKENSTSIYNAIPTAIDFDINSNNVDNIIADARRRKDVSLYDGNSYKTDYGQDENGEYISFYRKDGNTLTDLFGTSKEYYDRRYIEPRDILKLKTEGVTINDKRRINNLTGAPLKNNKKGVYGYPIIEQIIKAANKYEIDPYVAISMALQETNLGKTGAGVENPFHMNGGIKETPENLKRYAEYFKNMKKDKGDIIDRAMNMMKNVSYKDMPKNPGNYSDEVWRIQSHNGWGYITPNTEIEYDGGGDRYEMKIPKEGVSMKKNPIYGRFIKQLKDESIATNKDIQRLVEYFSKNSSKIIKK